MPDATALSIVQQALTLRRDYPQCSAQEAIDAAFEGSHGRALNFGDALDPRTPFGQLIAEAFDRGMEPGDWLGLMGDGADPLVIKELERIWSTYVLARFENRYGLPSAPLQHVGER